MQSLIISCLVLLFSVLFVQFALFMLSSYLPTSSFITLLPLTALLIVLVVGLGRGCKRLLGVKASAPAFVFFCIFFIWVVYISVIRRATSLFMDIFFNTEIVMLIVGLCSIVTRDPGYVRHDSQTSEMAVKSYFTEVEAAIEESQSSTYHSYRNSLAEEGLFIQRGRYCKHCDAYVKVFDHHCPAFGNCIGENNHLLFILLLVGFLISEASYVACASQFAAKFQKLYADKKVIAAARYLAIGTLLFTLFQILWQAVFILWHVHCACFNIKTDEWINWKKYPEFHDKIMSDDGQQQTSQHFKNPYDKGILRNLKDFVTEK